MTTTLSEGVKVPDVGSVNWAGDLEVNWNLLNGALANLSGNVKTDRDNTWTGEQSFTLPIVGSITGTASKAIADEDGNSIKTNYGKLSGNQTWTGSNIYEQAIRIAKTSGDSEIEIVNKNIDIKSNTTAEMDDIRFMDKNGKITGGLRVTYNNTQVQNSLSSRSWSSDGTTYSNAAINIVSDYQNSAAYISVTSDFLPTSTNNRRLGNASYQWASVYAQTYYYNGTAWGLDKENVWTGNNIFNKNINPASVTSIADTTLAFNGLFNTIFLNTRGSSNRRSYGSFLFVGYGSASGADNYGQIQLLRSTDKRGDTNEGYIPDTSFKLLRVNPHSLLIDFMENVRVVNDGTYNTLCPITTDTTDLGTSTNKWKTLNGINPGALSLPDFTSETGISLSAGANTYTPVLSGWLSISTTGDISVVCGNFCHKATDMISVPVIAGKTYTVTMPSAATGYFYSCLGNV